MKIVEMKNKNNEKVLPGFIEQEVSNSKIKVPSSYAVNEIIRNEYILTYLNGDLTSSLSAWTQYFIPMVIKNDSSNSKLSINSDGKLVIGDNVNLIEVSFSINFEQTSNLISVYGRLTKNNNTYVQGILNNNIAYGSVSKTIILPVTKGDLIGLSYMPVLDTSSLNIKGTDGNYFETYMYVKILK